MCHSSYSQSSEHRHQTFNAGEAQGIYLATRKILINCETAFVAVVVFIYNWSAYIILFMFVNKYVSLERQAYFKQTCLLY